MLGHWHTYCCFPPRLGHATPRRANGVVGNVCPSPTSLAVLLLWQFLRYLLNTMLWYGGFPVCGSPCVFLLTAAPPAHGLYMDVGHTSLRLALAQQLTLSKQTVPHYTVSADVNVDNVLKLREKVRAAGEGGRGRPGTGCW